jgi:hypothetical protein
VCLCCYCFNIIHFTQTRISAEARGAYHITLVMSQFYHLMTCRTRRVSIFTQGFFTNSMSIFAVIIEVIYSFFSFKGLLILLNFDIHVLVYRPVLLLFLSTFPVYNILWVRQHRQHGKHGCHQLVLVSLNVYLILINVNYFFQALY